MLCLLALGLTLVVLGLTLLALGLTLVVLGLTLVLRLALPGLVVDLRAGVLDAVGLARAEVVAVIVIFWWPVSDG